MSTPGMASKFLDEDPPRPGCLGHKLDRLFPLPSRNFLFRHCPVLPFSRTLDVRLSGDPLCQPVCQRLLSAPERQTLRVELAMIVAHKVLWVCRRNAGSAEPNRRARAVAHRRGRSHTIHT